MTNFYVYERRCKRAILALAVIVAIGLALAYLTGCESRTFTATRSDGTTVEYKRVTLWGDSSTEGVSVSRDGDDFAVDVGPTGSSTAAELAIEAFGIGLEAGRRGDD